METSIIFFSLASVFLGKTALLLYQLRWVQRLPGAEGGPAQSVLCSVVIAARDEEARIEQSLQHLLRQGGVELEIIVVNDRSKDRTAEIVEGLAKLDSRIRLIQVEALPPDWLGKCHACHMGASAARGEWILFTDADCWLKPDAMARALGVARRERVDHVTLTPGVAPETIGAQAWHLAFLVSVADWMVGTNRDEPGRYLGMGAFNFVRTELYRKSGGYEALRLTVLDDVKMGLLVRRAGGRTRAYIGGNDVECHWGRTVGDMVRVMEKNYFATLEYRTALAFLLCVGGPLAWGGALLGPLTGTVAGIVAGLAGLSMSIPAAIIARRLGWNLGPALLVPFMFPVLFYAVFNSTWKTIRQGGVRWRETFYPLETLRKGTLR